VSFAARVRRAIFGLTDEEISEKSQAMGGPAYPIPPFPTTLPTALTSSDEWMPDTETDLPAVKEEIMPDHQTEDQTYGRATVESDLDEIRIASDRESDRPAKVDLTAGGAVDPNRDVCPHCRGTGYVLTTNDLLRESIALLGDAGDDVMRLFYENLLNAAPYLAPLFPRDLTTPGGDGAGKMQRDKLLGALVAVSQTYDPDHPEQMQILDTHLETFGRSHAAFDRGNGRVQGATLAEYNAVKVVLFNTLHDVAGALWRPEYDDVWSEAYDYAAGGMLFHGMRSGFKSARYARP
jgi:hemoglobin-like flavoprotein